MQKVTNIFGRTRALESQIDEFLDKVSEAGLVFSRAMKVYLDQGACPDFEGFLEHGTRVEHRGDDLRRTIETALYAQTLIPDFRGDVLSLLEDMDDLVNIYEANLYRFSIEKPVIPSEYHRDFQELTETVVKCVETVVLAARAFFRDSETVRVYNAKVMFYESEADKISTKLKRAVFASNLDLAHKTQLRYFVERVDELANQAEDIADYLAIYTIKRKF
jgi:predicted phosphate transport protein (TIGR00153 family)